PMEIEVHSLNNFKENGSSLREKLKNTRLFKIFLFHELKAQTFVDFLLINVLENSLLFLNNRVDFELKKIERLEGKVIFISDLFFSELEKADMILKDTLLFNELFPAFNLDLFGGRSYFNNLLFLIETEINSTEQVFKLEI